MVTQLPDRRRCRSRRRVLLLGMLGMLAWSVVVPAVIPAGAAPPAATPDPPANDEPRWRTLQAESSEAWPAETRPITEPPPAPPEIQQQIERGQVEFFAYAPKRFPRRYEGETRLWMTYEMPFRYRWRLVTSRNGQRTLMVYPRVSSVRLVRAHKVLLPTSIVGPEMFAHPLVRHEMDHVRVSNDARLDRRFDQWIQERMDVVRVSADARIAADARQRGWDAVAQDAIQSRADELFASLMELVQIRYRELDRITSHGTEPLADDFFSDFPEDARESDGQ